MQKRFYFAFLFFIILFSATLNAEEVILGQHMEYPTVENLPLKIEGEKVDYLMRDGLVVAIYKASILYKDIKIFADTIEINVNKEEITAIDSVYYVKGKTGVRANYLSYNLKDEKGYFKDNVEGDFQSWRWKGERINILSENKFVLSGGSFTTCDEEPPHYHLSCSSATLDLEENKAVAKNVLFFIDGLPIFYFPFYYVYLEHPPYGLVNWVGHSDEKGWMDLAHYNWYVNDNFRGRVYLDYLEKLGWGEGFDVDLETPHGKNYIYGYYMYEDDNFYDEDSIKRYGRPEDEDKYKRWKSVFKHRQEWAGDLTSILKIEKFSDENFHKDFYFEEINKGFSSFDLSRAPENYFSLEKIKPNYNSILYVSNALNDWEYLIERKPSISFSTREQKVEDLPLVYKIDANYSYLEERFPEDEDVEEDTELARWDILGKVSSPHKIGNWIVSEPYITLRETAYSEDVDGDEVFRSTESVGWNFRTKLVRPYGDVQHIFQPQIGYYYRPNPSIPRDELIRLDPIDRITSQNGFFVEFINRLKVPQYEKREEYLPSEEFDDFYYLRESQAQEDILASSIRPYENDYREAFNLRVFSNYSTKDNKWDNVFMENTIIPIPGLSLVSDATYTPEENQFQIVNSAMGISKWEKCGGSLGISYYRGEEEDLYHGNGSIWFNLPSNMLIQLATTYDIEGDYIKSNGVYIKKPLHCWTAELQLNSYKRTRDEDYTFEVFLTLSLTEAPGFQIPLSRTITPVVNE